MELDLNDLLASSLKISRTHKILWGFGALNVLIGYSILPLAFVPMLSLVGARDVPVWLENPWWLAIWGALFGIVMLASVLLSPWMRAALTVGALRVEHGAERLTLGALVGDSRNYYLRYLGLYAIFIGGMMLVNLAFVCLQSVASILTLGLASMCLSPLSFLLIPLMYVGMAWMELAEAAIVVQGQGVMEAVRGAWAIIRENRMSVLLLTLLLYLGVGLLTGVFALPLMLPFMVVPISILAEGEMPRTILIASGVCVLAYLPLLAIVQGAVLSFIKSGWLIGYLQLTHSRAPALIRQGEPA